MLQEYIISNQDMAWFYKSMDQKSLTEHEPKRHRRYDVTHVNIARFINSFRLSRKIEHGINRIVKASLRAQTTHHKALHDKTSIPTAICHVHVANHGKSKFIACMDH